MSGETSFWKKRLKPDQLELFNCRFSSVVEEMGEILRKTALSVNIKHRQDFSCALFTRNGQLVASAPHIPVHLGALTPCVKALQKLIDNPNDIWVTNHPRWGGSHLPDITLVAPIEWKSKVAGYLAVRAHHAEIGGITPGSMPTNASNLEEEGVVITPFPLISEKRNNLEKFYTLLTSHRFPSRKPEENLADIQAQIAAINLGKKRIRELIGKFGIRSVSQAQEDIITTTAEAVEKSLEKWNKTEIKTVDYMDDGTKIKIRMLFKNSTLYIDFSGTSRVHKGNLNTPFAVTRSVIAYFVRLLIDKKIVLNDGLLRKVKLAIPECFLNPSFKSDSPSSLPAVFGGNVETSQRLIDLLVYSTGISAESQGTMNNVVFGNQSFGYYETLGGGSGATSLGKGTSAIHVHMTNTAISDPELVEHYYPVIIEKIAIRKGSGGKGKFQGGEGIIKIYKFKEKVTISILGERRKVAAKGLEGGGKGKVGQETLVRVDGSIVKLEGRCTIDVSPGEKLIVETPGGGGYGN